MKQILFIATALMLVLGTSCSPEKANAQTQERPKDVVVETNPMATEGAEVLKAITAKYQGKVALIDFWATWCGPCMMAMKQIDPLKEQYMKDKKDVVFVYVTGETSPLPNWKTAITKIKGYHYRLSKVQFNNLLQHLGIQGIPSYMVINKDGTTAYDNIAEGGYPGDDVIKAEIDKALTK